jgi:hypothetical protein
VSGIIAGKTAKVTQQTIADRSRFEKDDTIVDVSSQLVGWYVAVKLKPITDKMVDTAAAVIIVRREARKAKKDNKNK